MVRLGTVLFVCRPISTPPPSSQWVPWCGLCGLHRTMQVGVWDVWDVWDAAFGLASAGPAAVQGTTEWWGVFQKS